MDIAFTSFKTFHPVEAFKGCFPRKSFDQWTESFILCSSYETVQTGAKRFDSGAGHKSGRFRDRQGDGVEDVSILIRQTFSRDVRTMAFSRTIPSNVGTRSVLIDQRLKIDKKYDMQAKGMTSKLSSSSYVQQLPFLGKSPFGIDFAFNGTVYSDKHCTQEKNTGH
jgi:hypothetical protein